MKSTKLWMAWGLFSSAVVLVSCGSGPSDSVGVLDLSGRRVNPLEGRDAAVTVFLFTRSDCPISNRYAPEVNRLCKKFKSRNVEFVLVYPDRDDSVEMIRKHGEEYGYTCEAVRDPGHWLVEQTGVGVTPEAAVYARGGEMVYRGRIDDRFVDFGKTRSEATTHDLEAAIDACLAEKPVPVARTKAVGCYLEDLR